MYELHKTQFSGHVTPLSLRRMCYDKQFLQTLHKRFFFNFRGTLSFQIRSNDPCT